MSSAGPPDRVLHVLAGDGDPAHLERLRLLAKPMPAGQPVALVTIGGHRAAAWPRAARIAAPLLPRWAAPRQLARFVAERFPDGPAKRGLILHCWSPEASRAGLRLLASREDPSRLPLRVLVEAVAGCDFRALVPDLNAAATRGRVAVICPTAAAGARIRSLGAPGRCATIPGAAEPAATAAEVRAATRARLGLDPSDDVIVALPGERRESGTFYAVWAALLAERVRPRVRLVLSGAGAEVERGRELAHACRAAHLLRTPADSHTLPALLAAADVAVFLPFDEVTIESVYAVMAAGVPFLGAATPCLAGAFADGGLARLCAPADPRAAARELLTILEDRESAQRRAVEARAFHARAHAPQRMMTDYADVYAGLAAD